jgi:hypothetical protein
MAAPPSPKRSASSPGVVGDRSDKFAPLGPQQQILPSVIDALVKGEPRIVGVVGPYGVGKTVLARMVESDPTIQQHFADGGMWIRASGAVSLAEQVRLGLLKTSPNFATITGDTISAALAELRMLLIVEDLPESYGRAAEEVELLSRGCSVLVTSQGRGSLDRIKARVFELNAAGAAIHDDSNPKQAPQSLTPNDTWSAEIDSEFNRIVQAYPWSNSLRKVLTELQLLCRATAREGYAPELTASTVLLQIIRYGATRPPNQGYSARALYDVCGMAEESIRMLIQGELRNSPGDLRPQTHRIIGPPLELLVSNAAKLARKTAIDGIIATRHLLAELLRHFGVNGRMGLPPSLGSSSVWPRLVTTFAAHIRSVSEDRPGSWTEFLGEIANWADVSPMPVPGSTPPTPTSPSPRSGPYAQGPPGFNSEYTGIGRYMDAVDQLDVEAYANRFGDLVALRETKLPLSIGLFGNWGAGKSTFINLIDKRVHYLTDKAKASELEGQRWCREIVPVYFNAWHYLDSNLWASLITHIFESLYAHLRTKEKESATLETLLKKAAGATAKAAEDLSIAQTAVKKARDDLADAEKQRRSDATAVDGLRYSLSPLLKKVSSREIKEKALLLTGSEKALTTVMDLENLAAEAKGWRKTITSAIRLLWEQPGRGFRMAFLVGTLVVVPVLTAIGASMWPWLKDHLHQAAAPLSASVSFVTAGLLWLQPYRARISNSLKQVNAWVREAREAQKEWLRSPEIAQAEAKLNTANNAEELARASLKAAMDLERGLEAEIKALHPEQRLSRFIEQRTQSSDYRGQLGLISLARRDFQELSSIFADASALKARTDKLRKEGSSTNADQLNQLSKSIERIVLYIDDLDRCQPDKVVEVLQAVHLLLAFPLFAVVVGVDQRCLRQSIRSEFKGLLTSSDENYGQSNASGPPDPPATPLDYLEKIFHIPFHLPEMGPQGYSKLIDGLASPTGFKEIAPEPSPTPTPTPTHQPIPDVFESSGIESRNPSSTTPTPAPLPTPSATPLIGSVPLEAWEIAALKNYSPLIRTPRAATRFLNTYRLVRAGIQEDQWTIFKGDGVRSGEFLLPMLLLAGAAGYPVWRRTWFRELRKTSSTKVALMQTPVGTDDAGWREFSKLFGSTVAGQSPVPSSEQLHHWINVVDRFSF